MEKTSFCFSLTINFVFVRKSFVFVRKKFVFMWKSNFGCIGVRMPLKHFVLSKFVSKISSCRYL